MEIATLSIPGLMANAKPVKIQTSLLALLLIFPLSAFGVESTFSTDNEGWIIIDHGSSTDPTPASGINFTDPNPGVTSGRLIVQDIGNDWNWIVSPAKFHGDWSTYNGLDIDLITDDATTLFNLRIFIADGVNSATYEFPLAGTPGGSVLDLSAPLSESEWTVSGNWAQLLANVTAFYVRIDLNNNVAAEADYVDRIALVDGSEPPGTTLPVVFDTENGFEYQLESSVDLQIWKNLGAPMLGDGTEMTVQAPLSDAPRRFFRVRKLGS